MAALDLAPTMDEAMLEGLASRIDASASPAYAIVYDGTRPATPGDTTTSNVLVTIIFDSPAVTIVGNELVFAQADALGDLITMSGNATWARFFNGDALWLLDCDVTDMAGAGPLKIGGSAGTNLYLGGRAIVGSMKFA